MGFMQLLIEFVFFPIIFLGSLGIMGYANYSFYKMWKDIKKQELIWKIILCFILYLSNVCGALGVYCATAMLLGVL